MKAVKIIIGLLLVSGPILTISKYNGEHFAQLVVPILVLILGIWLIKSGLTSKEK
jgi:hypothetical protein